MTSPRATPVKLAALFALCAIVFGCSRPVEVRRVKLLMGTKVEITAEGRGQAGLEKAIDLGFKEIERLEAKFSRFREDSTISRINRAAGISPVQVDPEVFSIIEEVG